MNPRAACVFEGFDLFGFWWTLKISQELLLIRLKNISWQPCLCYSFEAGGHCAQRLCQVRNPHDAFYNDSFIACRGMRVERTLFFVIDSAQ